MVYITLRLGRTSQPPRSLFIVYVYVYVYVCVCVYVYVYVLFGLLSTENTGNWEIMIPESIDWGHWKFRAHIFWERWEMFQNNYPNVFAPHLVSRRHIAAPAKRVLRPTGT